MDPTFLSAAVAARLGLRRMTLCALGVSLAANLALSAALLVKKPPVQTILVPSPIFGPSDTEWAFDEDGPDARYLQRLALALLGRLAVVTPASVERSFADVLPHVDPEAAGAFERRLHEEAKGLAADHASLVFYPISTAVERSLLEVDVRGVAKTIIGSKIASSRTLIYRLSFAYRAGRLFLRSMKEVEDAASHFRK